MSLPLVINGVTYNYPQVDDLDWGPDATDWASAVTTGMLQKAGGLFQLLAEADFGTTYGLKSLYYKSRTTNPADAGQMRLARADVINWRNQANSGNLSLGVSSSNILQFNGTDIQSGISVSDTATIDLTFSSNTLTADIIALSITNAMISASAAIAFSKLATLSSANILVGSAGNVATSVAVTGDVTISNAGVTAIGTAKVVNAMLANMAQSTFKGRAAGAGTGVPVDLTATQATAILNAMVGDSGSGGTKGLVPAPITGDAAKFLQGDGTWGTPTGSGDVVGPGSSTNNGFAKFNGTTGKLIKNSAATLVNADIDAAAAIAYSKLNLSASIVNADIAAAAAIAVNKLAALTVSRAVVTDGSGFLAAATTTAAEIGFVNGVTSAIQTQINTKLPTTITTTGDLIYSSSGTTAGRLAIGGTGQFLQVVTGLPAWGFQAYRSVTTTDAPTNADYYLVCSGNSFTMTLPTAASMAGKEFIIVHNGTSLTQVYTLATTSAQTIGGVASGSYALYTVGETLRIFSNGANWLIAEHNATTDPATYTPTLTGTAFGTVVTQSFKWSRNQNMMKVRGFFICGTVGAALGAIPLPGSMVLSTTNLITAGTANLGSALWNNTSATNMPATTVGPLVLVNLTGTSTANVYIARQIDQDGTTFFVPENVSSIGGNAYGVSVTFEAPISGWQP